MADLAATSRPLVVAHRGASGHRPEHTEAAYRLGYRLGADAVEPDVIPSLDGVLVCRHDLDLNRTTDVAQHPEFAHRRRTLRIGATLVSGWFVHDFTLAELKTLRCRERWPTKRPQSAEHDGEHPIVTLEELLGIARDESERRGTRLRVNAEIKHAALLETAGFDVSDLYHAADDPMITWMAFEADALRKLVFRGMRPGVQLTVGKPNGRELDQIAEYAAAIGVRRKSVLPTDRRGTLRERPTRLVEKAHKRGLDVLVWTLRPENKHLPASLRIGERAFGHGHGALEAGRLLDAGVDGLIADYPELALTAVNERAREAAVAR